MRFENVCIEAIGYELPDEVVTSLALEDRLAPLYERFKLRQGRLELMSGIRERRFWPRGERPSRVAAAAGRKALTAAGLGPQRVGCLIHASVCRDFLEPATASVVHAELGLAPEASAFDLSNACLGVLNGMVVLANMIERGAIEVGLVVAGEDGRPLVETTIEHLLSDPATDRDALKSAFASLTIGSGSVAVALAHRSISRTQKRLLGGAQLADTSQHELCHGGPEQGHLGPLMATDSEALLQAGNALAARTFERFLEELAWTRSDVERIITHQVGAAHRRLLFETLELDPALDFPTVESLGNVGSVSLPISLALAREAGFIAGGERVALIGIGSGLHSMTLAVEG